MIGINAILGLVPVSPEVATIDVRRSQSIRNWNTTLCSQGRRSNRMDPWWICKWT